jgi:phage shock protein A
LRGELFAEFSEELTEYIETHEPKENSYLSEDYEQLKQHYSIVLEYVQELENKLQRCRNTIRKLKVQDEVKQETDNVVFNDDFKQEVKSLKTTIAGLKSTISRQQKKEIKLKEIIVELEKEITELQGDSLQK